MLRYLKERVPPGAREARMYNMAVAFALREGLPEQAKQLSADMAAAGVARDGESWHLAMRLQVRSTPPRRTRTLCTHTSGSHLRVVASGRVCVLAKGSVGLASRQAPAAVRVRIWLGFV